MGQTSTSEGFQGSLPLQASIKAPEEGEEEEKEMGIEDDASMVSRDPSSRSDASDPQDFPSDPPSVTPAEHSPLSPALSSCQDIVSVIKLKFEGDMLPPSPRKSTCIVREDSGFHQEEEDPVFQLPLFPTLQEYFGLLQEDLRNPPNQGSLDSAPSLKVLPSGRTFR